MVRNELRSQTSTQTTQAKQARLDHTRIQSYTKSMWSTAQSKLSVMMKYFRLDTIVGQFQWYMERDQRTWEEKKPGVQRTPYQDQGYRRRLLTTKEYHDAAVKDISDDPETIVNYFRDVSKERAHSLARLMDKVMLESFLDVLIHEGDASPKAGDSFADAVDSATQSAPAQNDSKVHATGQGMEKAYRDIGFVKAYSADVTTPETDTTAKFEGKDLELIKRVFSKRHLNGTLCMSMTPNLRHILREDDQFNNAENIYANKAAANAGFDSGMNYRGVKLIDVKEDQIPNLAKSAVGTYDSTKGELQLGCRTLNQDDSRLLRGRYVATKAEVATLKGTVSTGAATLAQAADLQVQKTKLVVGEKRHLVTVKPENLAYVWVKSDIGNPFIFAKRPTLSVNATDRLQEWSMAKMDYARRSFGALIRDEDYTMVVPFRVEAVDIA